MLALSACGGSDTKVPPKEINQSQTNAPKELKPEASKGKTVQATDTKCHVKIDEDGNKDISNPREKVGVVLADDQWDEICNTSDSALMAGSDGLSIGIVKVPFDERDPSGVQTFKGFVQGVQKSMEKEGGYKPVAPMQKSLPESDLVAHCFNGSMTLKGQDAVQHTCVTMKVAKDKSLFVATVTWFVHPDTWKMDRKNVVETVDDVSTSWYLFEELAM